MPKRLCQCGCGQSLEGRPPKTRFFDEKHRKTGFKARHGLLETGRAPSGPATIAALPEDGRLDRSTVGLVTAELEKYGRADTYLGGAALRLAERIDMSTAVMGFAALVKELRATMDAALEGVAAVADPVDELKAWRDRIRAG